jgi:glycerol-3-phosphate dehydrogenase
MVRRFHHYYEHGQHGIPAVHRVAELMGEELGWDSDRVKAEAQRYVAFVHSGAR